MFGQRKKNNKEEVHQKKKWEFDFVEGDDDLKIDNENLDLKEIPKQDSDEEIQAKNSEISEKNLGLQIY